RAWNSAYGGVYVEKTGDMVSNPFMKEPDMITRDGRVFTLKPPAVMTKEISTYAGNRDQFFFRITSLKPLNPANAPDAFERDALNRFESGQKEYYRNEMIGQSMYFRYMAPLFVEESCLGCHGDSGYKTGEVRGGISVNIDVGRTERELKRNFVVILVLGVLSLTVLLLVVFYFTGNLIEHINASRRWIEELIITDDLTGISNRRHLLSRFEEEFNKAGRLGLPLGCVMFDLDRFKAVNDKYGHLAGDEVLRRFAALLSQEARSYDVLGRLGGEEFIVVLTSTGIDETRSFAERVRAHVEDMVCEIEGVHGFRVTVSAGVTVMREDDTSIENILGRADEAMYAAKAAGRNRVC
ncbi:hypothetical protein LCGC14_2421830, partial [marine sediment metagenome]